MSNDAMSSGQWKDVTSLLREAASEMTNTAPMVHVEGFSLLDSMSAVEIMDPIMDQCCGVTGSMKMDDLLTVHYPETGLTPTVVVKLFQSLMMYEAAFLDGASIMESINQCIFSWAASWTALEELSIESVLHRAVLAYCKSVIFTTGCAFKAVLAADIYEDEDFQAGHRSFLSDGGINGAEVLALLEEVSSALQAQAGAEADPVLTYLIALLSVRRQLHVFHRDTAGWVEGAVREYTRLLTQRHACSELERAEGASKAAEGAPSPSAALETSIRAAKKRNFESCMKVAKLAQATAAALQGLLDLHKAGAAAEAPAEEGAAAEGSIYMDLANPAKCPEVAFALNSKLVKFHQTGPIRRVELKPFLASVAYVQGVCKEVVEVSAAMRSFFEMTTVRSVTDAVAATPLAGGAAKPGILTYDHVLHTAAHVSAAGLHLLTRSFFYCALLMVLVEMPSLLWASMYCKGLPRALIESELVSLHWLTGNPSSAATTTLKGLVVCRSRLFAARMQNILELWGHSSSEALYVDSRFHQDINGPSPPASPAAEGALQAQQLQWCSLWALQYTVFAMDLYMALMADLDLVGVEEWDYFYWYWDYLCSTGVFTAEQLRTQRFHLDVEMYEHAKLEAARAQAAAKAVGTKKGKQKGGRADAAPAPAPAAMPIPPVQMPASREELILKAKGMLCRGVYRMCILAENSVMGIGLGPKGQPLIDKTEGRWSSWETKFRHRFQAFAELSNPPMLDYVDFLQATMRSMAATAEAQARAAGSKDVQSLLAQGTTNCFQHARKVLDEARAATLAGSGTAAAGADKYATNTMVTLTKVSVASSLSAMKVQGLAKSRTEGTSYTLGVNRSYSKHFPVLDVAAATAVGTGTGTGAGSL